MVRIHKGWLAYGFAAALMTAGPFAFAHDQAQQDQSDPNQQGQTQGQYGSQKGSMQGQTQGQSTQRTANAQQKMDQEKQALRDKVKKALDDNQAHIDSFQSEVGNKTGAERTRDDQILKQAIQARDALNVDLSEIDAAQAKDWGRVRSTADADLKKFQVTIRRVAAVHKAAPRQGRPQGSTQQQPQKGGSQQQQGGSGGSSDTNK